MLPDSARQSIKIVVDLSWWTGLEVEGVINAIYDRRAGRSPRDEGEREREGSLLARSLARTHSFHFMPASRAARP